MARTPPIRRAGPAGRASISTVLMGRPGLMDSRLRSNADLLSTGRRTARAVPLLNLGLNDSPPPTTVEQMARIELAVNAIIANLQERSLMEAL